MLYIFLTFSRDRADDVVRTTLKESYWSKHFNRFTKTLFCFEAMWYNKYEALKVLLKAGADANATDNNGMHLLAHRLCSRHA